MLSLIKMQQELKEIVKGQDAICDSLCLLIYKYLIRAHAHDHGCYFEHPLSALLCGKTGCGKTYTLQTLASICNLPFYEINSKSISQEGWYGTSFLDLLIKSGFEKPGIIFLDEFDKLALKNDSTHGDVSVQIQASILKYIEGYNPPEQTVTKDGYKKLLKFNFHKCIFFFSGAFTSIYESKAQTFIGFLNQQQQKSSLKETAIEEFAKAGVLPEVLGRVHEFYFLNDVTEDVFYSVLYSDDFIYTNYIILFKKLGINLAVSFDSDRAIQEAIKANLGVRGLVQSVESQVSEIMSNHINDINLDKFSPFSIYPYRAK